MTLKTLIDNGLLNNCSMIGVDEVDVSSSFNIEENDLFVYIEEDYYKFPLDNTVEFDGLSISVNDHKNTEHDLYFMICSTIDPEKFKNL